MSEFTVGLRLGHIDVGELAGPDEIRAAVINIWLASWQGRFSFFFLHEHAKCALAPL